MGDASMENLPKEITKAQVLKVGHHGAKSVINTNTLKILNTETSFTINNYLCNQYGIKQQNNTHLTIIRI